MEKHIRKAKLTVTLTDQLGQAKNAGGLTSDKEAKRLAFYLYWNVKPFTRCVVWPDHDDMLLLPPANNGRAAAPL